MKRLAGIALGLSLLMPTLHYETRLFDAAARAIDGGPALSNTELQPPVDVSAAVARVTGTVSDLLQRWH